ncbi:MAG TPA: TIGR03086 family metal-binding protein [Microlunatus sp.]|nr:TIGR03086 family metal-binding protein [Microlunatus sp.]
MVGDDLGADVAATYRRSLTRWIADVERIGDAWTAPTPCSDWDVRQLVNHVVGEDRWTGPLVSGMTIAEVGDALDGDLLGDDPKLAARAAVEEAMAAVGHNVPDGGIVHLSYGQESLAEYLWQLTADHLIHGWDLAAATGQDRSLDTELVDAVGTWFAQREPMYRSAGVVGARPEGAIGGSPGADLLIAFGRDPAWTATAG